MIVVIVVVVDVLLVVLDLVQLVERHLNVASQSLEVGHKRTQHRKDPKDLCVLLIRVQPSS